MVTESLRNVLTAAGLTPDHTDLTLLADAVQALAANNASIAEMVAASITDKGVTPGRQKYHPMHIKKVVRFPGAGSDGAITPSVNIGGTARVERKGSGYYRCLWSTTGSGDDMAGDTYSVMGFAFDGAAPTTVGAWGDAITSTIANIANVSVTAQDATGVVLKCEGSNSGSARDPAHIVLIVLGALP